MSTSVAITADLIKSLAQRRDVVAEFPFLAAYAKPVAAGCCGKSPPQLDVGRVAAQIANLPPDRRQVFKNLLGADTVTANVVKAGRIRPVEI